MTKLFMASMLALSTCATPIMAQQQNCAERTMIIEHLQTQYGESRSVVAMAANGSLLEILSSEDSGTWTAISTRPDGISCMLASGTMFDLVNEEIIQGEEM